MSHFDAYRVTTSDGREIHQGDELTLTNGLSVTYLGIECEPWGDDETGEWYPASLSVRYSWGAVETVPETRAGVTVNEV